VRRSLVVSLFIAVVGSLTWFIIVLANGWKPELGLDLQGGIEVVLEPTEQVDDERLDQAIEVIRNRVDALGVAEPDITRQGDLIIVQLPGVADAERARELIGQTAELRFRPVISAAPYDNDGAAVAQSALEAAQAAATSDATDGTATDGTTDTTAVETEGPTVPETTVAGDDAAADTTVAADEAATDTTVAADEAATETTVAADEAATETTVAADEAATTTTAPLPTVTPEEVITPREEDEEDVAVILPDQERTLLYVLAPAEMTGEGVDTANASLDPSNIGNWQVVLNLTSEGSDDFDAMAAENFGNQVAIALDGLVYSAPTIQAVEFGGSAQITGQFSESEAKDLALVLRFGSLPVELQETTVRSVSATLGDDALQAGIIAGIVGLLLVAAFMISYYRLLGLVAILGLAVSGLLMWSTIATLGETSGLALTLAGTVGIIVSIGVQVDSNIVYYERLKEDLRKGRSLRVSADSGFSGAFSTILKADFASLIGALVLYRLTVGSVRGFALFLGIATIFDLVVSLLFMRPMAVWLSRRRGLSARRVIGIDAAEPPGRAREKVPVP
jgi:preprotein translocase subunit SecD